MRKRSIDNSFINQKIDIVYDQFNQKTMKIIYPGQKLSIDEAMCGFIGRSK